VGSGKWCVRRTLFGSYVCRSGLLRTRPSPVTACTLCGLAIMQVADPRIAFFSHQARQHCFFSNQTGALVCLSGLDGWNQSSYYWIMLAAGDVCRDVHGLIGAVAATVLACSAYSIVPHLSSNRINTFLPIKRPKSFMRLATFPIAGFLTYQFARSQPYCRAQIPDGRRTTRRSEQTPAGSRGRRFADLRGWRHWAAFRGARS